MRAFAHEVVDLWRSVLKEHCKLPFRVCVGNHDILGMKQGTGGSPGVKYLQSTLFNPVFPDLWAIRSRL